MAEEHSHVVGSTHDDGEAVKDRGLFDHFAQNKEEEKEVEEFHVVEQAAAMKKEEEEEKKHSLLDKLHRSNSSSSGSSSDEEERGDAKKKKKGLHGEKKEKTAVEVPSVEDTAILVEKVKLEEEETPIAAPEGEKQGFLDKIKGKLQHKKAASDEECVDAAKTVTEGEKKGFLDMIKEKLPGRHHKNVEETTPGLKIEQ